MIWTINMEPFILYFHIGYVVSIISASQIGIELEDVAVDAKVPSCRILPRGNASNSQTVWMFPREYFDIEFCLKKAENVTMDNVRYSNDGGGDVLTVTLDGIGVGKIATAVRSNGGEFWNNFLDSGSLGKLTLDPGVHNIVLNLTFADRVGIELDSLVLGFDGNMTAEEIRCNGSFSQWGTNSFIEQKCDPPVLKKGKRPFKAPYTTRHTTTGASTGSIHPISYSPGKETQVIVDELSTSPKPDTPATITIETDHPINTDYTDATIIDLVTKTNTTDKTGYGSTNEITTKVDAAVFSPETPAVGSTTITTTTTTTYPPSTTTTTPTITAATAINSTDAVTTTTTTKRLFSITQSLDKSTKPMIVHLADVAASTTPRVRHKPMTSSAADRLLITNQSYLITITILQLLTLMSINC